MQRNVYTVILKGKPRQYHGRLAVSVRMRMCSLHLRYYDLCNVHFVWDRLLLCYLILLTAEKNKAATLPSNI
jgi:hypothetical protein